MMSLSGSAWMWSDVKAENLYNKELNENREFLSVYEAIDIETGKAYPKPATADKRIANAIQVLRGELLMRLSVHSHVCMLFQRIPTMLILNK